MACDKFKTQCVAFSLAPVGSVRKDRFWLRAQTERLVGHINFHATLMNGTLSFLLFAGTLQVKSKFRREDYVVVVFSILVQGLTIGPLVKRFAEHETVGKGGA